MQQPRVLYSFPHRLGADRICSTAWHQVMGVSNAGGRVIVFCGSLSRPVGDLELHETLSRGRLRVPYRLLGRYRALQYHDWATARWLETNAARIDLVHGWPSASLRTMRVARRHGIPFLLERPNAHTRYAYEAADEESRRVGIVLPKGHDHEFNEMFLRHEETEYEECDYLLCPSGFVSRTFTDRSIESSKILRHQYGFDGALFSCDRRPASSGPLIAVYAGVCEPRKGLHYALRAWIDSDASKNGEFIICGRFVPGYAEKLQGMLDHPSVSYLGHRNDLPALMRLADIFVLSSVEEGSALVTYEARGSGCVLLVSDATGACCRHRVDGMVHSIRSVDELKGHFNLMERDRQLLEELRHKSISQRDKLTWSAAGKVLFGCYAQALSKKSESSSL